MSNRRARVFDYGHSRAFQEVTRERRGRRQHGSRSPEDRFSRNPDNPNSAVRDFDRRRVSPELSYHLDPRLVRRNHELEKRRMELETSQNPKPSVEGTPRPFSETREPVGDLDRGGGRFVRTIENPSKSAGTYSGGSSGSIGASTGISFQPQRVIETPNYSNCIPNPPLQKFSAGFTVPVPEGPLPLILLVEENEKESNTHSCSQFSPISDAEKFNRPSCSQNPLPQQFSSGFTVPVPEGPLPLSLDVEGNEKETDLRNFSPISDAEESDYPNCIQNSPPQHCPGFIVPVPESPLPLNIDVEENEEATDRRNCSPISDLSMITVEIAPTSSSECSHISSPGHQKGSLEDSHFKDNYLSSKKTQQQANSSGDSKSCASNVFTTQNSSPSNVLKDISTTKPYSSKIINIYPKIKSQHLEIPATKSNILSSNIQQFVKDTISSTGQSEKPQSLPSPNVDVPSSSATKIEDSGGVISAATIFDILTKANSLKGAQKELVVNKLKQGFNKWKNSQVANTVLAVDEEPSGVASGSAVEDKENDINTSNDLILPAAQNKQNVNDTNTSNDLSLPEAQNRKRKRTDLIDMVSQPKCPRKINKKEINQLPSNTVSNRGIATGDTPSADNRIKFNKPKAISTQASSPPRPFLFEKDDLVASILSDVNNIPHDANSTSELNHSDKPDGIRHSTSRGSRIRIEEISVDKPVVDLTGTEVYDSNNLQSHAVLVDVPHHGDKAILNDELPTADIRITFNKTKKTSSQSCAPPAPPFLLEQYEDPGGSILSDVDKIPQNTNETSKLDHDDKPDGIVLTNEKPGPREYESSEQGKQAISTSPGPVSGNEEISVVDPVETEVSDLDNTQSLPVLQEVPLGGDEVISTDVMPNADIKIKFDKKKKKELSAQSQKTNATSDLNQTDKFDGIAGTTGVIIDTPEARETESSKREKNAVSTSTSQDFGNEEISVDVDVVTEVSEKDIPQSAQPHVALVEPPNLGDEVLSTDNMLIADTRIREFNHTDKPDSLGLTIGTPDAGETERLEEVKKVTSTIQGFQAEEILVIDPVETEVPDNDDSKSLAPLQEEPNHGDLENVGILNVQEGDKSEDFILQLNESTGHLERVHIRTETNSHSNAVGRDDLAKDEGNSPSSVIASGTALDTNALDGRSDLVDIELESFLSPSGGSTTEEDNQDRPPPDIPQLVINDSDFPVLSIPEREDERSESQSTSSAVIVKNYKLPVSPDSQKNANVVRSCNTNSLENTEREMLHDERAVVNNSMPTSPVSTSPLGEGIISSRGGAIPPSTEENAGGEDEEPILRIRSDLFADSDIDEKTEELLAVIHEKGKQIQADMSASLLKFSNTFESGDAKQKIEVFRNLKKVFRSCYSVLDQVDLELTAQEIFKYDLPFSNEYDAFKRITVEDMAEYFLYLYKLTDMLRKYSYSEFKSNIFLLHFRICRILKYYAISPTPCHNEVTFMNIIKIAESRIEDLRDKRNEVVRVWDYLKSFSFDVEEHLVLKEHATVGLRGFGQLIDSINNKCHQKTSSEGVATASVEQRMEVSGSEDLQVVGEFPNTSSSSQPSLASESSMSTSGSQLASSQAIPNFNPPAYTATQNTILNSATANRRRTSSIEMLEHFQVSSRRGSTETLQSRHQQLIMNPDQQQMLCHCGNQPVVPHQRTLHCMNEYPLPPFSGTQYSCTSQNVQTPYLLNQLAQGTRCEISMRTGGEINPSNSHSMQMQHQRHMAQILRDRMAQQQRQVHQPQPAHQSSSPSSQQQQQQLLNLSRVPASQQNINDPSSCNQQRHFVPRNVPQLRQMAPQQIPLQTNNQPVSVLPKRGRPRRRAPATVTVPAVNAEPWNNHMRMSLNASAPNQNQSGSSNSINVQFHPSVGSNASPNMMQHNAYIRRTLSQIPVTMSHTQSATCTANTVNTITEQPIHYRTYGGTNNVTVETRNGAQPLGIQIQSVYSLNPQHMPNESLVRRQQQQQLSAQASVMQRVVMNENSADSRPLTEEEMISMAEYTISQQQQSQQLNNQFQPSTQ